MVAGSGRQRIPGGRRGPETGQRVEPWRRSGPFAPNMKTENTDRGQLASLSVGALGVVYGDIGTSPLYAMRQCFQGTHSIPVNLENVLGVLSLILWSLLLMVSVKYLSFIMRADNKGEGGILALMSLAFPEHRAAGPSWGHYSMIVLGVFGASLLYGDGMITPAITVLGAIEGLKVATPFFTPYVTPITVVILIGLFLVQRTGTGNVGRIFGPVMIVWFVTIALLGLWGVVRSPGIVAAINRAIDGTPTADESPPKASAEALAELKQLLVAGLISQDDYDRKKDEILARI